MKSIEIKSECKYLFLEAVRLSRLEVVQLQKVLMPGRLYYKVITVNYSQDDIFKLGVYFAQLSLKIYED